MRLQSRSILAVSLTTATILATSSPAFAQAKKDPGTIKARAPQAENPPLKPRAPDPAMEKLLVEWEKKSSLVKSLHVKYKRTDDNPLFEVKTYYEGQAYLKSPSFAYLDFYKVNPPAPPPANAKAGAAKPAADAPAPIFDERIVCNGKKVFQFKGPTRQVFIFPLAKDEKQKALEEGPLPFLFNMSVKKAKERYEMMLAKQDDASYIIKIIPLLKIDRDEYSQAMVQLDKKQLLPMAIKLWSPDGKNTKLFTFKPEDVEANGDIPDSFFDGHAMIYGPNGVAKAAKPGAMPWAVVDNPGPMVNPEGAVNAVPAGRAGAQPAMKTSGNGRK